MSPFFINRVGEIHTNKQGCRFEIIECLNNKKLNLRFLDDYGYTLYNRYYIDVLKGEVKNPYYPSVYNIGYLGVGEYSNKSDPKIYEKWKRMIHRCYDEKSLISTPCYKDITVCDEWHNFQNFAKWYEENYNPKTMEGWQLYKDILQDDNKVYSPETCCFVPQEINKLFIKSTKDRGNLLTGVSKLASKFIAQMSINGKRAYLGIFNTVDEAFQAYKTAKEQYIKEVAEKWKGKIDKRVYKALINYKVEITD